jgi:MFS family permease
MSAAANQRAIRLIYAAVLCVGIGYGLSTAVVSLFLKRLSFQEDHVGFLGSCFALGIVLGSLVASRVVEAINAKRTLLLGLLGYAVAACVFPLGHTALFFALSRGFDGAFSVLVWVSIETELLLRAEADKKARVMSLYAICLAVGYIVGPIVARGLILLSLPLDTVFFAAGVLALCACGFAVQLNPVQRLREATSHAPVRSLEILTRIRASCFATFAYGYFQISVVTLLPLYLMQAKAIPEQQTVLLTAIFALGMLAFSQFASRMGDEHGHLKVMRVLASIGMVMVASFVFLNAFWMMALAVLIAGASLASISPVSLAYQGAVVAPEHLHRANSFYNSFYALGMLLGPTASGLLFRHFGGPTMLLHLTFLWALFVVFTLVYAKDDPRSLPRRRAQELEAKS